MIKKAGHYLLVSIGVAAILCAAAVVLYGVVSLAIAKPIVMLMPVGAIGICYVLVHIDAEGTLKYE